jgi:hypothetical protein
MVIRKKNNRLVQLRRAQMQYQRQMQVQQQMQPQSQFGEVRMNNSNMMRQGPKYNLLNGGLSNMERARLSDPMSQARMVAQKNDNIMNAPRFMMGELKNTGGSILTTKPGDDILHAPDVMKGQLRNINATPSVAMGAKPQTMPHNEQYIEIDSISNKPMIKRRTSEKWATGEAL